MKKLLFLISLTIGCIPQPARMVQQPTHERSAYGPVNEKDFSDGTIRYRLHKNEQRTKDAREDAYRQMYESCRGDYKILSERDSQEGTYHTASAYPAGRGASGFGTSFAINYRYIDFQCAKQ